MRLSTIQAHYLEAQFTVSISTTMIAKLAILACLLVLTKQEPHLATGLSYIANYASSYDAHTVNHDIRVPVAPVAPIVKAAALTAAIPQVVSAYSPVASIVKAAPIVSQRFTALSPVAPLTSVIPQAVAAVSPAVAAYSVAPVASTVPVRSAIASALPAVSPSPTVSPVGKVAAAEDIKSDRPAAPQNQQNQVPDAVLLASRFLARNTATQQGRSAGLRTASQETKQTPQLEDNQERSRVLATTPTGFGLAQRTNARFAQFPQNDQAKANLQLPRQRETQNTPQNAKLIRQNEDSESVVVENASSQAYVPETVTGNTQAYPAKLAALAPSINLLPNVYTSVITF
ncbi:hypothetical protein Trydic_g1485 [Trypoxylus dichotomus]